MFNISIIIKYYILMKVLVCVRKYRDNLFNFVLWKFYDTFQLKILFELLKIDRKKLTKTIKMKILVYFFNGLFNKNFFLFITNLDNFY